MKLDGLAAEWHDRIWATRNTWSEWIDRLREAFASAMSMLEWHYIVEARMQRPRESVTSYIFDKVRLMRPCPQRLSVEAFIRFLFVD